ncbi:MAG TPA: tryptophan 2,3-dioxygenase family protein, partial [Nitrososphaerales archaeon]|nr:tryptophan 2,3-dioxygenase family protein [Nitrososphaerales archaeon]
MAQRKLGKRLPSYSEYLKLDQILRLQSPVSSPPQHDELLFVVAHQTYELWFKLMLSEIDGAVAAMKQVEPREASRLLRRVVAILHVLTQQLEVLETIRPGDFAKFRDSLRPASGFQSTQFREIEFVSGQKDPRFLELHKDDPVAFRALSTRLDSPSLWDAYCGVMSSRELLPRSESGRWSTRAQLAGVKRAFSSEDTADVADLADALLEYDEAFWLWRNHHVGMVERIIGRSVGTGSAYVGE